MRLLAGLMVLAMGVFTGSAHAQEAGGSVEGYGGFAYYYESCCDGPGWAAGGAVSILSDVGLGARIDGSFHRTSVNVYGVDATTEATFVTISFQAESSREDSPIVGFGYFGGGWGHLEGSASSPLILPISADGFALTLGAGIKFYLNDNLYFSPALNLTRGYGDISTLHFNLTGGFGASF